MEFYRKEDLPWDHFIVEMHGILPGCHRITPHFYNYSYLAPPWHNQFCHFDAKINHTVSFADVTSLCMTGIFLIARQEGEFIMLSKHETSAFCIVQPCPHLSTIFATPIPGTLACVSRAAFVRNIQDEETQYTTCSFGNKAFHKGRDKKQLEAIIVIRVMWTSSYFQCSSSL